MEFPPSNAETFYLLLVRPMRARRLLAIIVAIFAYGTSVLAASNGSATLAYQKRIQWIVMMRVGGALIPGFHQIQRAGSGSLAGRIRLLATGQVESVTLTQRHPASFANSTCTRVISSTKFPPIPARVLSEQGHPYVDITYRINVN
jgi:hypothetical protein